MRSRHSACIVIAVVALVGCQQDEMKERNQTAGTELSAGANGEAAQPTDESAELQAVGPSDALAAITPPPGVDEPSESAERPHQRGHGPGRRGGPGMRGGNREDMTTIHALFDARDRITRTVKNLPNGAETVTESADDDIAGLIQEHVPAMEGRVNDNNPLPPMTFHPLFVELIKHAGEFEFNYEATEQGLKVTYTSDNPYVVLLIQEHAQLVSRFIKNGMEEIHRPYQIPDQASAALSASKDTSGGTAPLSEWPPLPTTAPAPEDNPTTMDRVELGKKLYFDPRLSLTGTVSCNSCHNVMEGGDDGRPSSMGILGRIGPRNAPTVWNSAFQTSQFWDGRSPSLEDQAKGPLLAGPEMGMPSHDFVIERIRLIPEYVLEFRAVFGPGDALNIDNAAKAIAAFERTLITPNSPYDRAVTGDENAMTAQQIRGLLLFDRIGCTECHSGPVFNGWTSGDIMPTFQEFPRFKSNPFVAKYELTADAGRFDVTNNEDDRRRFKVPTLRNVTLTAPYLHNGAVESLDEAVRVMGATQLETDLNDEEVADIVAFLSALEGRFPTIILPRIPSLSGESILRDQAPAETAGASSESVD